jgi:hypothetical protein
MDYFFLLLIFILVEFFYHSIIFYVKYRKYIDSLNILFSKPFKNLFILITLRFNIEYNHIKFYLINIFCQYILLYYLIKVNK